jgi:sortase A
MPREEDDPSASPPRRRAPWLRPLERVLWVAGLLAIGWVGWGWVEGQLYQAEQERLLAESLAEVESGDPPAAPGRPFLPQLPGEEPAEAAVDPTRTTAPSARAGDPRQRAAATRRASTPGVQRAASAPLARLTVPRLGMSVMVGGGIDSRTLRRAAGHIPGTAPLGSAGNVGLAGHRDSFFRPLRKVEVGDEVVLTTPTAISTYRVEWAEVVTPEAIEVLRPTPYPALTLVTCYPFTFVGTAPDRFVVRARLVESRAPHAVERVNGLAAAGGR